MADLSSYLMSGTGRRSSVSPEALELMGKQAANMYLSEGVPLNEGVAKLAGAHADISAEQVRRVVEYANTAVYLSTHDMNKTAGASASYPQFELADAARVIQDLSDGARPTVVTSVDRDYATIPQKVKTSSVDDVIEQLFGKQASAEEVSSESAINQVMRTKSVVTGLINELEKQASQLNAVWTETSAQYYDLMKSHILEGESFADILVSARTTGVGEEKIASLLQPHIERLVMEKVSSPNRLAGQAKGYEKVAHRVVNKEHPLVTSFGALAELDEEISKTAMALENAKAEASRIQSFIQETFRAAATR